MATINSLQDIQALVVAGETNWQQYGDVRTEISSDEKLILFNYTARAQYANRWNFFEQVSRGLILEYATGQIVTKPFPKFFNWGQKGRITTTPLIRLTEKADGSLGIIYFYDEQWQVATRGNFTSEQAQWAQEKLADYNLENIDSNLTLLVEIVYPSNRVVVDYGNQESLILLEVLHRQKELSPETIVSLTNEVSSATSLPQVKHITHLDLKQMLEFLSVSQDDIEGYVGLFADGTRFKFKTDFYVERHKWLFGLSKKMVGQAIQNKTDEQLLLDVPDEFLEEVEKWHHSIVEEKDNLQQEILDIYQNSPQDGERKNFAKWVMSHYQNYKRPLFLLWEQRIDDFEAWCLDIVVSNL